MCITGNIPKDNKNKVSKTARYDCAQFETKSLVVEKSESVR